MPSSGERMPHTEAAFQRLSAGDTIPTVRAFLKTFYPLITDGARNLTIKRASKRMALAVAAAPPRAEGRRAEEEQDQWGMQWAEELNQEQRRTLKRRREVAEEFARRVNRQALF